MLQERKGFRVLTESILSLLGVVLDLIGGRKWQECPNQGFDAKAYSLTVSPDTAWSEPLIIQAGAAARTCDLTSLRPSDLLRHRRTPTPDLEVMRREGCR